MGMRLLIKLRTQRTEGWGRMMKRASLVTSLFLLVNVVCAAQSQHSEAETLQQILTELRAIHEALRVSASTQLLVAESQMQQGIVSNAMQDVDNAQLKINGIHQDQKQIASEIESAQKKLDEVTNADEKNAISADIEARKSHLAGLKSAERDWNSTLLDMSQRLKSAQDKLEEIDVELNATISHLRPASNNAK